MRRGIDTYNCDFKDYINAEPNSFIQIILSIAVKKI
jgi:hypothetical protein